MAAPLAPLPSLGHCLEGQRQRDWLWPPQAQAEFWRQVDGLSQALESWAGELLVVAEPTPLGTLAAVLAGLGQGVSVVLTNPHWGEAEWRQVTPLVQPDWTRPLHPTLGVYPGRGRPPRPQVDLWIATGGSSGQIRFAGHTWSSLMTAVQGFRAHLGVTVVRAYCVLPLYHVSGLMQALRVLATGGTLALHPYPELKQQGGWDWPPGGFLSLVPSQLQWLLDQGDRHLPWLRGFDAILLGGAPAWPALLTQARCLGLPLAPTYGLTETAGQVTTLAPAAFLAGDNSSGPPLPHVDLQVLDPQGQPLGSGQTGVLSLQTTALAQGYWPDQSPPSPADRFLTEDLGYRDGQGHLHLVGRRNSLIISGGEKVLPQEIEALLLGTGQVADVWVVGIPDRRWGQRVCALIVPSPEFTDIEALAILLRPHLAPYKQPKQWQVVTALPRTPAGKLRRTEALALIDGGGEIEV